MDPITLVDTLHLLEEGLEITRLITADIDTLNLLVSQVEDHIPFLQQLEEAGLIARTENPGLNWIACPPVCSL